MARNVLHIAFSTEEAQEVLRPTSEDERIVREEVLFIRTAQVNVNLISGLKLCLIEMEKYVFFYLRFPQLCHLPTKTDEPHIPVD